MSWIKTIDYNNADQNLKRIYNKVKGPENNIDNVLLIHSLRPHTLIGHMALYKNVLHNANNTLPKWYLEVIGIYVSNLNNCSYCVQHHFSGLCRLLQDDTRANAILSGIKDKHFGDILSKQYAIGLSYAYKLTLHLSAVSQDDIRELITGGFTEGEILEINQVTSYFNYVNRTVVGLGVNTDGDILGLSPNDNDDPNNWSHS